MVIIITLSHQSACRLNGRNSPLRFKGGYNQYILSKTKPSKVEAKRQKKADRKARRAYKNQLKQTSLRLYNKPPAPAPEKQKN